MCNITVNPHSHPRNEVWLLSPFYRWENSVRLGVWTSILTPPHPLRCAASLWALLQPLRRYCGCGPGEWPVKGCWNTPCPCCLSSYFHLPSEKRTGHGQPRARQLLPLHVPWESVCHGQDPRYSFLWEPVQSNCFTCAWNHLKVLHWQLSSLGKHIKLANKSLWGQHIKWFPE